MLHIIPIVFQCTIERAKSGSKKKKVRNIIPPKIFAGI